jgi:hypothetical protein
MAMVKIENLKVLKVDDSIYVVADDGTMLDKLREWKVLDSQLTGGIENESAVPGWDYVESYLASHGLLVVAPEVVNLDDVEFPDANQVNASDLPTPN